ncbi:hypothetical protein [Sphingobium phenoxybenzoativorans]|nr:hypothetical protein [Sphingobium phenoxybenzoativorans]
MPKIIGIDDFSRSSSIANFLPTLMFQLWGSTAICSVPVAPPVMTA